jgi:triacylglycerol lipase
MLSPAQGALLAWAAEGMYSGSLYPALDESVAAEWDLIDYLSAQDALLGLQRLKLGERVFYGFLARLKADPKQYVVAIRGTETAKEWLIDAEATLVNHVHLGFFSIYGSMNFRGKHPADGITEAIPPDSTVTIVGHSLGAPLACYLMNDLVGQRDCYGLFYAMPKPGDAKFAADFKASEARYTVINYASDVVPTLPPFARFAALQDVLVLAKSPSIPDSLSSNHSAAHYAALLGANP